MLIAALVGFCFGFLGSVPVAGPVAALVFQRGLCGRFRAGILIGFGAAVAEAGYAFHAFWGFSTFLARYPVIDPVSRLVAAVLLLALGVVFARHVAPPDAAGEPARTSALGCLAVGFSITALNPTLIATWTAATTTLQATHLIDLAPSSAPAFALGSLVGIAGWFLLLIGILRRYRGNFRPATLLRVVRAMGWGIAGLGLFFGYRFVAYVIAA